jgi:hypothetical protein
MHPAIATKKSVAAILRMDGLDTFCKKNTLYNAMKKTPADVLVSAANPLNIRIIKMYLLIPL